MASKPFVAVDKRVRVKRKDPETGELFKQLGTVRFVGTVLYALTKPWKLSTFPSNHVI